MSRWFFVPLAALLLHATAAFAQPACPVDTSALSRLARVVSDPALRRELVAVADRPITETVFARGGRDGFLRAAEERIATLERGARADPRTSADADTAVALYRTLIAAARCLIASEDPRTPVTRAGAVLPISAIGLVKRMLGFGTGALVGECLVVTNEHVVSRGGAVATTVGDAATFYAGEGNLEGFAEWVRAEVVALGPWASTHQPADDWAVLRLDRPLGTKYGTLRVQSLSESVAATRPLWALGFPGEGAAVAGGFRELWSHKNCRFLGAQGNAWAVSCVASQGQSGGPILAPVESGLAVVAMMTAVRRFAPLGTQAAASGQTIPITYATATGAFATALNAARATACPNEPQRLRR